MKNNFRVFLAIRRMKLADVSRGTGISRTTLTNLYYERLKNPNYATLSKVASFLDISIDDLINSEVEVTK